MAYVDNFDTLFKKGDDLTTEKIILKFFNIDEDLALKTEIPRNVLMDLNFLRAYEIRMRNVLELIKSADIIHELIRGFLIYMVSADRQGRIEGKEMIAEVKKQLEKSGTLSRLLGTE